MVETGPQNTLIYRQETLKQFFQYVQTAESFYLIGAASMGKTRLLDLLMKPEVQKRYLGQNAGRYWLIRVDLNRMPVNDPTWAFYELLISSILLTLSNYESIDNLAVELTKLDSEIIQKHDPLLALRFFELAVNKLCQVYELKLCFILDEFDEPYRTFPREIFLQLRAIRDANKSRVSFALFLRNLPERLRPPADNESFYELLSRNLIGLGPYNRSDGLSIIQQLETRRDFPLTMAQREKLYEASGGHPGIMQAILGIMIDSPRSSQKFETPGWVEWLSWQPTVMEEFRKIWDGLSEEEQDGLSAFARGESDKISLSVEKLIFAKGLLYRENGEVRFFSQLFKQYIRSLR